MVNIMLTVSPMSTPIPPISGTSGLSGLWTSMPKIPILVSIFISMGKTMNVVMKAMMSDSMKGMVSVIEFSPGIFLTYSSTRYN